MRIMDWSSDVCSSDLAEGWKEEDGVPFFEELEYRDYDVTRERIGASLSFDWRASDTTELYARGLYSRFEDQDYRRRLLFDLCDAEPVGGTADTAQFVSADHDAATTGRPCVRERGSRYVWVWL